MTINVTSITFDCEDALTVATFWAAALGHEVDPDGSSDFASIGVSGTTPRSPGWMFAKVPEGKTAKNRMHVDLVAADRGAEVDRLVDRGAKHVRDVDEWGHRWTVLQDPEGNEFCVAQEPAATTEADG